MKCMYELTGSHKMLYFSVVGIKCVDLIHLHKAAVVHVKCILNILLRQCILVVIGDTAILLMLLLLFDI